MGWTRDVAGPGLTLTGILPLVTGLVGWCPLYAVLGLSSCPMKRA